jgi:hypothetical protein
VAVPAGLAEAAPAREAVLRAEEPGRNNPRRAGKVEFSAKIQRRWRAVQTSGKIALIEAPVAQLDRALPSEGRGREFESRRVRQ